MHSLKTFLTFVLIAAAMAGCAPSQRSPADISSDVTLPPLDNETTLLAALEKNFSSPDLHYRLGRVYQHQDRISMARFQYERALAFDPMHFDSQAAMVRLSKEAGNTEKAAAESARYISAARTGPNLVNLGMAMHRHQLYEQARRCYERAVQIQPDNPAAYKGLGLYYLQVGDEQKAGEMFARSFEIDPYQPDVARELGRLGVTVKSRVAPPPTGEKAGRER